jgi:hypothetical protein
LALGLSLRIAASFHDRISPRKIRARVAPSRVSSPDLTPSTLITTTTPATTVGNWIRPSASSSRAPSGMSDAPKVISLLWTCRMPSAEPTER